MQLDTFDLMLLATLKEAILQIEPFYLPLKITIQIVFGISTREYYHYIGECYLNKVRPHKPLIGLLLIIRYSNHI